MGQNVIPILTPWNEKLLQKTKLLQKIKTYFDISMK